MNVKISLTIPMEKVPGKVSEMLDEVSESVDYLSREICITSENISSQKDLLNNLSEIDYIRKKMITFDSSLQDCYNILKGYINFQYDLQNQVNNNDTSNEGSSS